MQAGWACTLGMVRSLFTVTFQFRPNLSLYRAFSNVHSDKIYGHQLVGEINIDTEREMENRKRKKQLDTGIGQHKLAQMG